eukprot:1683508-Pyramimonas_sp.AAC.1
MAGGQADNSAITPCCIFWHRRHNNVVRYPSSMLIFLILAIPWVFSPSSSALFAEVPPWRASGGLTKVLRLS